MKPVKLGNRIIGDDQPVFVTFEAGPTHSGVESAKRLISHAANAGADAIKFQIIDPDRLVADKKLQFEYEILIDKFNGKTKKVSESLYELLKKRSLSSEEWKSLKKHADDLELSFFATVGFDDELQMMLDIGCDSIKIASADVNYLPFIREVARSGVCIQIDTGSSTIEEIETAIDAILSENNERIIIHHCPSGYPARLDSINLRIISTLKKLFPYPIAFSDHTPGRDMDIAAIALGANLVEKTITEDRTTPSVEHLMSIEPDEMVQFVKCVKDMHIAFGQSRKILQPEELEKRQNIRRSVFLVQNVKAGDKLKDAKVEFRRPGDGLTPDQYELMVDACFSRDIQTGTKLIASDLIV